MKWFSYEIDLVNPKTNAESAVTVLITELQRARAKRGLDWSVTFRLPLNCATPIGVYADRRSRKRNFAPGLITTTQSTGCRN